jgi:hypothetical protein
MSLEFVVGSAVFRSDRAAGRAQAGHAAPALDRANVNRVLTKGWLSGMGIRGRVCWLISQSFSVGVNHGLKPGRASDPDKSR